MDTRDLTYRLVEIAEAFRKAERLVDDLIEDRDLTPEQKSIIVASRLGTDSERDKVCAELAEAINV